VYWVDGLLELGRVGLNKRLKDGGRKKTKDGPLNSVGRRVVVVTVVVIVEADYLMCWDICYVSGILFTSKPTQRIICKLKIKMNKEMFFF
jgi:hypothetical protein